MAEVNGGADLAGEYYREIVGPALMARWPRLPHAAARLGGGSDVLGLDDSLSRDHDWGLRLTLLVGPDVVGEISGHLEAILPDSFAGLPTRFATTWDPMVRHRVEIATTSSFVTAQLGLDATAGLTGLDWLCLTGQSLLEVTAGPVFADSDGQLTDVRQRLAWYPDPVWRYVVAADWIRLGEDLPLMGRCGQRCDELGSRLLAGRIVNTCMHLAFLLVRRWPPYPKWLGTVFARLPVPDALAQALDAVLSAQHWQDRQDAAAAALDILGHVQSAANLPVPATGVTEQFFDRPFRTVCRHVADLLLLDVTDPLVRRLPPGIGAIEQWADNVTVLTDAARRVQIARSQIQVALADPR